eukprot:g7191.t1
MRTALSLLTVASAALLTVAYEYPNEFKIMPGHDRLEDYSKPLPKEYTSAADLPTAFSWMNINNTNFLTKSLNQHIPQYCGSCWAHGAASAFADRIKIARGAKGVDINMAIQYILNCGGNVAGSCHGGSASGTYQLVKDKGFWPYDTCLNYEACSAESKEGACGRDGADYSCSAMNTCRTCSTFSDSGGKCAGVSTFPNATIAEYGQVKGEADMMAEIYRRGPIACTVDATPLHKYNGGVFDDSTASKGTNHIISIVGWGLDKTTQKKFWVVRNSWGEYWGELGYFRLVRGENQLGIEGNCAWATPGQWTEHNFACWEDGSNCVPQTTAYRDPSGM